MEFVLFREVDQQKLFSKITEQAPELSAMRKRVIGGVHNSERVKVLKIYGPDEKIDREKIQRIIDSHNSNFSKVQSRSVKTSTAGKEIPTMSSDPKKEQTPPAPTAPASLENTLVSSLFPIMQPQIIAIIEKVVVDNLTPALSVITPALQGITDSVDKVTQKVDDSTEIVSVRDTIEEKSQAVELNLTALIERKCNEMVEKMGVCQSNMAAEVTKIRQDQTAQKGEIRKLLQGMTLKVEKVGG